MTQLDLFPTSAYLTRIDPEENAYRYYSLAVTPDLFGGAALERSWGRIGVSATTRIELHPSDGAATDALGRWRAKKLRRGYQECRHHASSSSSCS